MDQFVDKWKMDCKPDLEAEDELKSLLNLFLVSSKHITDDEKFLK
jgi:hypothetical protein